MKLTKLQRYTAYCLMEWEIRYHFKDYDSGGFCMVIKQLFDVETNIVMEHGFPTLKEMFPELHSKITRNEFMDAYLFLSWDERKIALKQCISETEPK